MRCLSSCYRAGWGITGAIADGKEGGIVLKKEENERWEEGGDGRKDGVKR